LTTWKAGWKAKDMPDFEFSCPHCSQVLEAPEDMVGEVVECPGCQQEITVTKPQTAAPRKPAAIIADTPKCPNCEEEMEPDAVLCVHCGYHTKLGKKITTTFE
jgi:DNA-directed RNA polymerase subunit M/transcription elongation factor TFIIS